MFNGEAVNYIWIENKEEIDLKLNTNEIMKDFRNSIEK
jgi:hypothetical protein